ncbi:hypothetical protein [Streptomyces sp. HNM0574]|uniref:hypothetical protein n=1 Tax=Streptomyces sp. HNM0574 TaxID=2714954 RepID=UPI00146DEDBB|nr:hypothetical protein [Streptomyces sp. HNM0574]NLU66657.1 hypothetical protein [Streptomyces sp. HNM0574]
MRPYVVTTRTVDFSPSVNFRAWRESWPEPVPEGGCAWLPGPCMLFCRREDVRVRWLGPVHAPAGIGALYACALCVGELNQLVGEQLRARDDPEHGERSRRRRRRREGLRAPRVLPWRADGRTPAAPAPLPDACEHAKVERRAGTAYCAGCGRQLYL